jgi:hypothetical protein
LFMWDILFQSSVFLRYAHQMLIKTAEMRISPQADVIATNSAPDTPATGEFEKKEFAEDGPDTVEVFGNEVVGLEDVCVLDTDVDNVVPGVAVAVTKAVVVAYENKISIYYLKSVRGIVRMRGLIFHKVQFE